MDLVNSGAKVIVAMMHAAKGEFKILDKCTYPLTGAGVVDKLITEKAVFSFKDGMVLEEIGEGISLEEVRGQTGCAFSVSSSLKSF